MNALIALILIGTLGLVFGRFLFLRPRPGSWYERFLLSGAEFFLIGALLGPQAFSVLDTTTVLALEPFLILALAWVGLLLGVQLQARQMAKFPGAYFRIAFLESGGALLVTLAVMGALFTLWTPGGAGVDARWRAALCLGAAAAVSFPPAGAGRDRARAGHGAGLLRFAAAVDPLVSLVGVAFLFTLWHAAESVPGGSLASWQWLGVSLLGGGILGGAFLILLWTARSQDETTLVVLGMALFSGGIASVYQLSPLVVCFVEGALLGNFAPRQERLIQMFLRLERPLYVILLVLAGAMWDFSDPWGYVLTGVFLIVRVGAKRLGVAAALALVRLPFPLPRRWWLGLVPQGALAVAVAASFLLVHRDPLARSVFGAILLSTLILHMLSGRFIDAALAPERKDSA